jgi:hypothetical protein
MQNKVTVTLILFLFPALITPLFIILLLTRIPGDVGLFFSDYAFAFVWGCYLLIVAGGIGIFYFFKRRAARQALADSTQE